MNWDFALNAANFNAGLSAMRGKFDDMFNNMSSGITKNISKFNAYQVALDYCVAAGKKMINESKELIAISSKYDIPVSQMGKLQVLANQSGQSVGQLARGFRFLEMNMGKALLKPGGPQYQAFMELGITQDQITKAAENTAYAMELVRQKVMTIGDEERRNAFLQEIYGANWQNMLVIIEANAQALKDAESSGYKYSSSMTESLAGIASSMEDIGQDLKPVLMPILQVIAMLVTIFAMLIEGLKLMIQLAGVALVAAFHAIAGIVGDILYGVQKVIQGITFIVSFGTLGRKGGSIDQGADILKEGANANYKSAKKTVTDPKVAGYYKTSNNEINKLSDKLGRNFTAFGESLGQNEEGEYIRAKTAELKSLDAAIMKNKTMTDQLTKSQLESYKAYALGEISKEEYMAGEKKLQELGYDGLVLEQEKKRTQEKLSRAGDKEKLAADMAAEKKRTQEERKTHLQRERQGREQGVKAYMANTPLVAEMESYHELQKSKMELINLEKNLQDLKKNNSASDPAVADMENSIANAKIEIMAKEKAHKLFLLKKDRELLDSEKDRKDNTIKAMEEREQEFMKRQGMTAMDKASVSVENAIQKMQRDEEQMNKIMNDPLRTQQEKLGAKKKFEESTMGAQKEFDKLSMMQFQYSASDAAKKGMGGGMDVRENTLTVAKSSLDYLKKSYELQLKQFGLSPDQFGNVPQQLTGPYLRGGGR